MYRALSCLIILSCFSIEATAQEVPPTTSSFKETAVPTKIEKTETATVIEARKQGTVAIGINWIFNYASNSNEVVDGTKEENTTSFMRLEPQFEYYFTPQVPLTLSAGWLRRSLNRPNGDTAASNEVLLLLGSAYHLEVTPTFSLIGSAALGGYFGSSEQTTQSGTKSINETTGTLGFGTNIGVGASQRFSQSGQFRAGLNYSGLFGSESIESTGKSFAVQTHNVALSIALFYYF